MPTVSLYNEAAKRLVNKEITRTTLKIMLLNGATFNPTETSVLTTLSAFQVSGNGWPVGGPTLSTTINFFTDSANSINTQRANLFASNISITATGGSIGPADAFVMYDSTTNFPVMYVDFEGQVTALVGTLFRVIWPSSRFLQLYQLEN